MKWSKYVKPYWKYFVLGPLCMIVEVVGEIVMPKLYSQILNVGVETHNVGYIILTMFLMILTAVLMMGGGVGGAYFGAKAAVNFSADLRKDVYGKVQRFSFANIDKYSTGSLVTRLTNDITQLQNFVNMMLRMFLRAPGMLIGALIMAITMNPELARILAVTIPVILVVEFVVIRMGFPRFTAMQEKIDKLNSTIQESLTNIRVVKSFVREDYEKEKFKRASGDLFNDFWGAERILAWNQPAMTFAVDVIYTFVIFFGSRAIVTSAGADMQVGQMSALITYGFSMLMSLNMLSMIFVIVTMSEESARRICEVLIEEPDLKNPQNPVCEVADGSVDFDNVSFAYDPTSDRQALQNINLHIRSGEVIGIIGGTGSSKSSLIQLISRLYDATQGSVRVGGVDVRDYDLDTLRNEVSVVLQRNVLFSGTIKDNLRWGDADATDEELQHACVLAQADEFVQRLPQKYDTYIEQGGTNVSGGQKQRLCIARALLKKPKILILDDSTSAVDTKTDKLIQQGFREFIPETTKIIIAQRTSSVADADRIVVLDGGMISAIGTHDELLKTSDIYREVYLTQNKASHDDRMAGEPVSDPLFGGTPVGQGATATNDLSTKGGEVDG